MVVAVELRPTVGDMDTAAEFMEQSCDEREPVLMVYFREYPDWQPLRNHPRFQKLVAGAK